MPFAPRHPEPKAWTPPSIADAEARAQTQLAPFIQMEGDLETTPLPSAPNGWTRSSKSSSPSLRRPTSSPPSNRTRVGATCPAPSRGPRLGLRRRAWVRQEATFGLARIHHPTWHPAWSRLPLPLPKQAHKTTGFAWRKWKAKGAAKMGAFDERAKTLDLREKLATFAPLEVRGCGEIGRHARLRIWCFGVGVRVPPPAPLQEKRQVNPCP